MDKKELRIKLNSLELNYKNTDRQYEIALTIFSNNYFDTLTEQAALEILEEYSKINGYAYFSHKSNITVEYSAFFSLIIYYRHQFDVNNLDNLWTKYSDLFKSFYSFNHLFILYKLFKLNGISLNIAQNYLKIAENNIYIKNSINNSDNPGFNHALADLFVSICEIYENKPNDLEQIKINWFDKAIEAAKKAIDGENEAAVFNCTYGRILSIFSEFDLADEQFNIAISKEKSSRKDHSLRIGKYNYYRNLNQTRKQASILKDKIDSLQEMANKINQLTINHEQRTHEIVEKVNNFEGKMDSLNSQINDYQINSQKISKQIKSNKIDVKSMKSSLVSNVETIGIFSGIVAFVIGSLNLVNGYSVFGTGLLIFTLMGGLTASLAVFSLLLHMSDNKKQRKKRIKLTIGVIIISLVLSIGAIVIAGCIAPNTNVNINNNDETSASADVKENNNA